MTARCARGDFVPAGAVAESLTFVCITPVIRCAGGVVFPIRPLVGCALGMRGAMIGLILSMNPITRLAVNPITGTLIDRFGARLPVAAGLGLETLGTLAYVSGLHASGASVWFIAGRAIWGVGSSGVLVGTGWLRL